MSGRALRTVRQRMRVEVDDVGVIEVVTRPFDYNLWTTTSLRHKWPQPDEVGAMAITFATFLAWSAARRTGQIPPEMTWEKFLEAVSDITELDLEEVDPTQPALSAG